MGKFSTKPWKQRKKPHGAVDEQRALLDQLMGKGRNNADPNDTEEQVKWDDPDVCPYFLCGFCPNDLFVNTRADLGCCDRIHEEYHREQYEKEPRRVKRRVEKRMLYKLYQLVSEVDRKISRGKKRIEMDKSHSLEDMMDKRKIKELEGRMEKLLEQMETLGNEGKVDEAKLMLRQVEELQAQKDFIESRPAEKGDDKRRMVKDSEFTVCDICAVTTSNTSADRHFHLSGKQHRGYEQIRNKIQDLEKLHEQERDERRRSRDRSREKRKDDRKKRRDSDKDDSPGGGKEGDSKDDDKEKEEKEPGETEERRRSRDRSRDRRRDRSRDRRRSRDRDSRRDRDRDRSRDRDRDRDRRRDRSRDRDRDRDYRRDRYRR